MNRNSPKKYPKGELSFFTNYVIIYYVKKRLTYFLKTYHIR